MPSTETLDNLEAQHSIPATAPPKKQINWLLLILYSSITVTGIVSSPLLQRVYYTHGGSSNWLLALLQSVGVVMYIPLLSFLYHKSSPDKNVFHFMDLKLTLSSAVLGLLYGFESFLYSAGLSSLPVSTSTLLCSTQLAFTAFFAYLIVKQKISFYSLNAVLVVSCGAVVLALHASGDKPLGESKGKYLLGFFLTLAASGVQGLFFPLVELAYRKSKSPVNSLMVLQFQFVLGLFASLFGIVGLFISKDHKILVQEAAEFDLGTTKYYVILVSTAVICQLTQLGLMGLISCTSSLFAGILCAVTLPMSEVASVITFGDKFNGQKGLSLVLCLWGFTSYFFGEYKKTGKTEPIVELNSVNSNKDVAKDTMSDNKDVARDMMSDNKEDFVKSQFQNK